MYVFIVLASKLTLGGFAVDVHGVYPHITQAMAAAHKIKSGDVHTRIMRRDVQTDAAGAPPDFTVAVGGTPGPSLRIGEPVPAGIRDMGASRIGK